MGRHEHVREVAADHPADASDENSSRFVVDCAFSAEATWRAPAARGRPAPRSGAAPPAGRPAGLAFEARSAEHVPVDV